MTGIERLRELAEKHRIIEHHLTAGTIDDIADQIEREQGGRVSRMRVLSVVTEMERHVSGVEGAEDSPVARWARELRAALGGDGRDQASDVSMSAYDLLPADEREAIAWVREHGGIAYVRDVWNVRSNLDRQLAKEREKVERQQRHIEFVQRNPEHLTHAKPEPPDSWERLEEDATLGVNAYRERHGIEKHDGMTWPQLVREDLVRRCRALAERERSE